MSKFSATLISLAVTAERISVDGFWSKRVDITGKYLILDKRKFPVCAVTVIDDKVTINDENGVSATLMFYALKPLLKKDIA